MNKDIHGTRDNFSLPLFLEAREKAQKACVLISSQLKTGMSEEDGHKIIESIFADLGVDKKWHPSKFRIGTNTTKSFSEKSDLSIILKENDIFFIDIGPVFNMHEADIGRTYVVGENPDFKMLQTAAKEIFKACEAAWREKKLTGVELYQFAEDEANNRDVMLNPKMAGHRLGDFPHHLFYRGEMSEIEESPCNHLWVLEIHILNLEQTHGAFFEDILIS